jgi:hypothetical protein
MPGRRRAGNRQPDGHDSGAQRAADLGLLVPSLRVASFHHALYESMSLAGKAVTAGRMLQRLGRAIRAELTAIESIERRGDENRRVRYVVAVGFVSAVAIPASLVLAFLGINASQVSTHRSMFGDQYLGMYLTVAAVIVPGAVLSLALYVQQRRDAATTRPPARGHGGPWQPMTAFLTGLPDPSLPLRSRARGEPAGNIQPLHDGRDVPADRGDAQPGPSGDRVIEEPFGHQLQDGLLRRRQPPR